MRHLHDLGLAIDEVLTRPFRAAPPELSRFFPAVRFAASSQRVEGWLVGVREGRRIGWWGPVGQDVASRLHRLAQRLPGPMRGSPEQCAQQLRRTTRHAHTGAHGVSVGAFELACWDLLGHRHGLPVWRLITAQATGRRIPAYATCFGMRLDHVRAPEVISKVRQVWPIQKWRPVRTLRRTNGPALRAAQAAGPAAVALDFGGVWPTRSALRYAGALELELAFIEEPAPPGALAELDRHPRPAPVAAGEHCYNVDETAVLLAAGIDVWQPDAVFCGGFAALRAIAARAARMGRPTYPHGGGLIPAIHAAIAGDPIALVEHHLLLEPRRQAHLGCPLLPGLDGQFGVPELPGWAGPLRTDLADG